MLYRKSEATAGTHRAVTAVEMPGEGSHFGVYLRTFGPAHRKSCCNNRHILRTYAYILYVRKCTQPFLMSCGVYCRASKDKKSNKKMSLLYVRFIRIDIITVRTYIPVHELVDELALILSLAYQGLRIRRRRHAQTWGCLRILHRRKTVACTRMVAQHEYARHCALRVQSISPPCPISRWSILCRL